MLHSDRRFGLMNTPTPVGTLISANKAAPGWTNAASAASEAKPPFTLPLPVEQARYRGLRLHGDRVVFSYTIGKTEILESARLVRDDGVEMIVRTISLSKSSEEDDRAELIVGLTQNYSIADQPHPVLRFKNHGPEDRDLIGLAADPAAIGFEDDGRGRLVVRGRKTQPVRRIVMAYARGDGKTEAALQRALGRSELGDDLDGLVKPGPLRWGKPLLTKLERGTPTGPFAIDTLTIPYDNPSKALFFCTGVDFLPDGRVAVCTCHGDVWLVTVDETAGSCTWRRFATGLYHPLGLKSVDGKLVVLETGQLTRLHDENDDGEADYYECVTNAWHTGGGEHSYDTNLETDPQGHYYFFKTGDTHVSHGGCLMRVSKDGAKVDVFATGFRHPIGLGMSPTGIVTGADQEGNWMPGTRIDQYVAGGFYGDMRARIAIRCRKFTTDRSVGCRAKSITRPAARFGFRPPTPRRRASRGDRLPACRCIFRTGVARRSSS
ncbi:MAG: hypothetical protein QM811_27295 [Pirellulales bacterium]